MSNMYRCSTIANMAHIYGVVTGYVIGTYKTFLPVGYHKTTHVTTRIPIAQEISSVDKTDYYKKSKPILAIKPKIEFDFDSEYLNSYFNTMPIYDQSDRQGMNTFFQDYDRDIYMDMSVRRIRFSFEITNIVETSIQQQNLAWHLINRIEPTTPYYLENTVIETVIPIEYITEVAKRAGYFEDGKIKNITEFVSYLNRNARQPITYKMKTSSGNHEFFTSYLADAIINFENIPSLDDGENKGQTVTNFMINQTCTLDVTVPGFIFFNIMEEDDFKIDTNFSELSALMDVQVIPIIPIHYEAIPKKDTNGWNITVHTGYVVEADIAEERVPIYHLFTESQLKVVDYHKTYNISEPFINVVVYENKGIVDASRISMDYTNMDEITLVVKNMETQNSYYMCVYENNTYINSILAKYEK